MLNALLFLALVFGSVLLTVLVIAALILMGLIADTLRGRVSLRLSDERDMARMVDLMRQDMDRRKGGAA